MRLILSSKKGEKVRDLDSVAESCYPKTLSILNIVTMFTAGILIGQRSVTWRAICFAADFIYF